MKIILLITENSEIIGNIARYKPQNLDLVVIRKEKYIKHYLEEYLPEYVIIDIPLNNLDDVNEHAFKNPHTTIFFSNLKKYIRKNSLILYLLKITILKKI